MLFDSFQELELLDLAYGGQLAGCRRLAKRAAAHSNDFVWGSVSTRGALAIEMETMSERVSAMDILDLLTKFGGRRA